MSKSRHNSRSAQVRPLQPTRFNRYHTPMEHRFTTRVYYEDTDLAGVVYYANYLRFIERARTEYVASFGLNQTVLRTQGLVFVVTRIEADYLKPARFADDLTILTRPLSATRVRLTLSQQVRRGDTLLFDAKVTLAAMSPDGRPLRLPDALARESHNARDYRRACYNRAHGKVTLPKV